MLRRFFVILLAISMLSIIPMTPQGTLAERDGTVGPWTEPVRVDDGPKSGREIESIGLALASDGTIHAGWLEDRAEGTDCFVATSPNMGDAWYEDIRVDPYPNQPRTQPTTCDIVVDPDDHLYAAYAQWQVLQGWWRVRWARSDDGGDSFRDPTDVFQVVDNTLAQEHPAMAITKAGSLNIIYLERAQNSTKLFIVRSDDGLNPLPPRAVESDMPTDQSHVQGDIAIGPDGTVYVAYGYRAPKEAGIKVARKAPTDGTFSITKVFSLTEDNPRSLRPTIAVSNNDVVEIVFNPLKADGHVLHIRSDDGGDNYEFAKEVWPAIKAGNSQSNPDLAFDELGRVHVVWTQGGNDPRRVLHSFSHDGISFTGPSEVGGSWNESLGIRGWEDDGTVMTFDDGGVAVAYSANLNSSVGVYFVRMDNEPPIVEITQPSDGAAVRSDVFVQGTAADQGGTTGLAGIFVQVADEEPVRQPGTTSWEYNFDSTQYPDGPITIKAWASDGFVLGPEDSIVVDVDNNKPPVLNLAKPENSTSYIGSVPVDGTAYDAEGFGENHTVQWRVGLEDEWSEGWGFTLQSDNILDFAFDLNMSGEKSGASQVYVRVSDGDKFTEPSYRSFTLNNLPDLAISTSSIDMDVLEPEHGEVITVALKVTNMGVVHSGPYDVSFENYNKPIDFKTGSNLSAGESENLVFIWDAKGGTNKLRFIVDPRFRIEELSKNNNEAELVVEVPKPPEDDGGLATSVWAVIALIIVAAVGGVIFLIVKFYVPRGPVEPEGEEVVIYEGSGGMYDEASGPYSGPTEIPQGPDDGGAGPPEQMEQYQTPPP